MAWTTPKTWAAGEIVDEDDLNTYLRDDLNYLVAELPYRATGWHSNSSVTTGNGITYTIATACVHNAQWAQSAAADGDVFTQSFVLAAGTYTVSITGRTRSLAGKIDWDLDGTSIATGQDWYSNPTVENVTKTIAGVVIAAPGGRVTLTGTVNGKNAASTGYAIPIIDIHMKQASD